MPMTSTTSTGLAGAIAANLRALGDHALRNATQTASVLAPAVAAIVLAVVGAVLWGAAVWSLVEWASAWIDPSGSLPALVVAHATLALVLLRASGRASLTHAGQLDSNP
jgi:hypothetical protein